MQESEAAIDAWLTALNALPVIDTSSITGLAVSLNVGGIRRYLTFHNRGFNWDANQIPVKFEIMLSDLNVAQSVFDAMPSAFHAFQTGHLRSTGYIMRTFAVIRAFQTSDAATADEQTPQ